jgi:hypothetical protein
MRPAFLADLDAIGPLTTYSITVAIDPESATLEGRQTVHYVNGSSSDQERVYFRLFPNLPGYGGTMSVGNLYVQRVDGLDSQPEEGELTAEGTALRVPLGEPLAPGEDVTLTMDFATSVPTSVDRGYGQFIYQADVMALANFFPLIPAYDEENCARYGNCDGGWNIEVAVPYGDAVFSTTALFDVRVAAPAGWTVVASGSTLEQGAGPGEKRTWHIVSGPMRDFTMLLSPRFEVATAKVGDILVNSYYLPEDRAGGERVLRWSAAALAFFNQQFGPYPFAELDVAATSTLAGGIEYPGLIVLPIRRYDQIDGVFQWSTVHEVAHQWWYSLVGNDQQDEPWLDEALTQYSTALFYELHEGWDEAVSEVLEARYQVVAGTPEDDLISRPVAAYTESNYGPVVYGKGPLFFDALRQRLGGDLFSEILRAYFKTYRYGIADGMDLLSVITSLSDQDLSELYQEWLGDQAGAGL